MMTASYYVIKFYLADWANLKLASSCVTSGMRRIIPYLYPASHLIQYGPYLPKVPYHITRRSCFPLYGTVINKTASVLFKQCDAV